jgi:hypothetical protein
MCFFLAQTLRLSQEAELERSREAARLEIHSRAREEDFKRIRKIEQELQMATQEKNLVRKTKCAVSIIFKPTAFWNILVRSIFTQHSLVLFFFAVSCSWVCIFELAAFSLREIETRFRQA